MHKLWRTLVVVPGRTDLLETEGRKTETFRHNMLDTLL